MQNIHSTIEGGDGSITILQPRGFTRKREKTLELGYVYSITAEGRRKNT